MDALASEDIAACGQRLVIVRGDVIELAVHLSKKEPQITDLRLDDFDQEQIGFQARRTIA